VPGAADLRPGFFLHGAGIVTSWGRISMTAGPARL
jgi:hypothetical protein